MFLEISQNSQENTCARVSFWIKLQATAWTLLNKRLWHRSFPVNFVKYLRTPFLAEHLRWLLFKIVTLIPLYDLIFAKKNLRLECNRYMNWRFGIITKDNQICSCYMLLLSSLLSNYFTRLLNSYVINKQ